METDKIGLDKVLCAHNTEAEYVNLLEKDTKRSISKINESIAERKQIYQTINHQIIKVIGVLQNIIEENEEICRNMIDNEDCLEEINEIIEVCESMHQIWKSNSDSKNSDSKSFQNYKNSVKNLVKLQIQLNDSPDLESERENIKSDLISKANSIKERSNNYIQDIDFILRNEKEKTIPFENQENLEKFNVKMANGLLPLNCSNLIFKKSYYNKTSKDAVDNHEKQKLIPLRYNRIAKVDFVQEKEFGLSFTVVDHQGIVKQNFFHQFNSKVNKIEYSPGGLVDKEKLFVFCEGNVIITFLLEKSKFDLNSIQRRKLTNLEELEFCIVFGTYFLCFGKELYVILDSSFTIRGQYDFQGLSKIKGRRTHKSFNEKNLFAICDEGLIHLILDAKNQYEVNPFQGIKDFEIIKSRSILVIFNESTDIYKIKIENRKLVSTILTRLSELKEKVYKGILNERYLIIEIVNTFINQPAKKDQYDRIIQNEIKEIHPPNIQIIDIINLTIVSKSFSSLIPNIEYKIEINQYSKGIFVKWISSNPAYRDAYGNTFSQTSKSFLYEFHF